MNRIWQLAEKPIKFSMWTLEGEKLPMAIKNKVAGPANGLYSEMMVALSVAEGACRKVAQKGLGLRPRTARVVPHGIRGALDKEIVDEMRRIAREETRGSQGGVPLASHNP
jgi:hypothetical protein